MKKVVSLFVAILLCTSIQAQIVSSRSVGIESTPSRPSETLNYLRVGLNIMGFTGDGADGLSKKMGYNFSYGFQKPIGKIGTYWGMEFGLGSRGFKSEDGKGEYKTEQSLIAHNIQVSPFTFGWKYGITDEFKVDVHAGAFVSCDYMGKAKFKYDGEEESFSMGDWEDELEMDWNRFDAGMNLGFGVWYDRFNLDFTYQRGFVEAAKESDSFTNNLMLRLGVAF